MNTTRLLAILSVVTCVGGCRVSTPQAPQAVTAAAPAIAVRDGSASTAELEVAFERAANTIAPSVVSVEATVAAAPGPFGSQGGVGLGSGVVLDHAGHILTNNHVVEHATSLKVEGADGSVHHATVVGRDPKTDLAVIRVDAMGALSPAQFVEDVEPRIGQWVIAYGSPFGLDKTVSAGIISATGRDELGIVDYEDFLQTDAAINPGNSGGPLVDMQGRVLGINTAILSRGGGSNGIGLAIPSTLAMRIARELVANGSVQRGWLGVALGHLDAELAQTFGYSGDGALVEDVSPEGPAHAALRAGDIVTTIAGVAVADVTDVRRLVAQSKPGTKVTVGLWRAGAPAVAQIKIGALPAAAAPEPLALAPQAPVLGRFGVALVDLTAELAQQLGLDGVTRGAVIARVEPSSPAAEAGLSMGDVVEEVGAQSVLDAASAVAILGAVQDETLVRVRIRRGPAHRYVALRKHSGKAA